MTLCVLTSCDADLGLQNDGAAMTMIPTYVTSVPKGTEKVRGNFSTESYPAIMRGPYHGERIG